MAHRFCGHVRARFGDNLGTLIGFGRCVEGGLAALFREKDCVIRQKMYNLGHAYFGSPRAKY